jgi:hypothetical protein
VFCRKSKVSEVTGRGPWKTGKEKAFGAVNSSDRSLHSKAKSRQFRNKFHGVFQGLSQSKLLSGGLGARMR